MPWSRRSIVSAFPAIVAMLTAGTKSLSALAPDTPPSIPGKVYIFDQLPSHSEKSLKADAPPIVLRELVRGTLSSGINMNLHESDMGPFGVPSHPPHKHKHEEIIMLIEGTLDFELNGVTSRGGPGSIMFSGPWDLHGITNPAATHAKYFVLELGTDFR
jgi:hypothetical protein